jgi:hypothetical protein
MAGLQFYMQVSTVVMGVVASLLVSGLTIFLLLRKLGRQSAARLLAEGVAPEGVLTKKRPAARAIGITMGVLGIGLLGWALTQRDRVSPAIFFTAGPLLLIGSLFLASALLAVLANHASNARMSVAAVGLRAMVRNHRRSLAIIFVLASGSFMVIAVGGNHADATRDAFKRSAGTGGFALIGQTSLPIVQDLNTRAGREFFGLDENDFQGVSFVPARVRDGDDASCLNLNRAQRPRLLGIDPALLSQRGAFSFSSVIAGNVKDGWRVLQIAASAAQTSLVPAVGDANSIRWALGKKLGDTIDYVDANGRPFRIVIVGAVANSILQGSLVIAEDDFKRLFPDQSGYRMFLIDAPSNRVSQVGQILSRAMQDTGLELVPAARRLAEFNAVQNTYLSTFQVLGGLALMLGAAGLGVVVLRNVFERRGELALLQAIGVRRARLRRLVLAEHGGLLMLGLCIGVGSGLVAIVPQLLAPGSEIPLRSLTFTLGGILASGLLFTWLATTWAVRGDLLAALRTE